MSKKKYLQIAIDGPVAAGKGTVAFLLGKKLGIDSVDSGTVTRMVGLLCLRHNLKINEKNQSQICNLVLNSTMAVLPSENIALKNKVFLDGEEVTDKIRTPEVDQAASQISSLPKVYKILTKKLQELAEGRSLVMEGRNITTSVLPNADLKIYLTAGMAERSRRRFKEYKKKGREVKIEFILEEIKKRDKRDSRREYDPLRIVPEAVVVDTTNLNLDEVVEYIMSILREKNLIQE